MIHAITKEQIGPSEAVNSKILRSNDARLVSSVINIGQGTFGKIYEIRLKRSITDRELSGSHWEASVHMRNVFLL